MLTQNDMPSSAGSASAAETASPPICPLSDSPCGFERELRVKEATIREVYHRVKNNLQAVESLLRMQKRRSDSPEVVRAFSEAIVRIRAMAVAHEMLSCSHDERVEIRPMVVKVADQVKMGLVGASPQIKVNVHGQAGFAGAQQASNLALVVAEIVHNAIEHGLEQRDEGRVDVYLARGESSLMVRIEDDGWGLPYGFSLQNSSSMGLTLVRTLVEDGLLGTVRCGAGANGQGTRFVLIVPLEEPCSA